jgi:hypothetical protein
VYRPYGSDQKGFDGDASRLTVLVFDDGCHIAESAPDVASGKLMLASDTGVGFHLVAAGTDWSDDVPVDWNGSPALCRLVIQD